MKTLANEGVHIWPIALFNGALLLLLDELALRQLLLVKA